MSDITKCTDRACPSRKSCYRWTAFASVRQGYADFNRPEGADKCEDFWPNKNTEKSLWPKQD
jgi:hypothetical protein